MKQKMVSIPLRLEGEVLRTMQELARLSGHDIEVVISVLVTVGFLQHSRLAAAGLAAMPKRKKR